MGIAYTAKAATADEDDRPDAYPSDWTFPGPPWPPGWPEAPPAGTLTLAASMAATSVVGATTLCVATVLLDGVDTDELNLHNIQLSATLGGAVVQLKKLTGDAFADTIDYTISNYTGIKYGISESPYFDTAQTDDAETLTLTATITTIDPEVSDTATSTVGVNAGVGVLLGASVEVYRSGAWVTTALPSSGNFTRALANAGDGVSYVVAGGGGETVQFWMSTDYAVTYTLVTSTGLPGSADYYLDDMMVLPNDDVLVLVRTDATGVLLVYRSTDGGVTFASEATGITAYNTGGTWDKYRAMFMADGEGGGVPSIVYTYDATDMTIKQATDATASGWAGNASTTTVNDVNENLKGYDTGAKFAISCGGSSGGICSTVSYNSNIALDGKPDAAASANFSSAWSVGCIALYHATTSQIYAVNEGTGALTLATGATGAIYGCLRFSEDSANKWLAITSAVDTLASADCATFAAGVARPSTTAPNDYKVI